MADRPKNVGDVLKMMKDKDVKFLDLRFTDTKGKMQHVTADGSCVDEAMFADGYAFDGSSIAGWKGIEASDMTLMPDPASAHLDPFFAQTTMAVFCDVLEPSTGEMYERDPRSIAKRAEAYMKQTGVGDTVVFGPEAEFFIFDDVKFSSDPYNTGFKLDGAELPSNMGTDYEMGNLGHRPRTKGGYFPVPPIDSAQDIRSEMLSVMSEMGVVGREASPRGCVRPARTRHQVRPDGHARRPHADLQVRDPPGRPGLRQDGNVHAQARVRRQRLGHALPPVDLEGLHARVRRQQVRGLVRHLPQLHRRHPQARQDPQRLHQPDHQLLQASGAGLRGARAARLLGAQPLGLLPHPGGVEPESQAHRDPLPRSVRQPLPGVRRHADGWSRRHPEQDQSGRGDRQEPLRPAAGGAVQDPDGVRQPCAKRS